MIPRIIHQIWLGPDPMPTEFEAWTQSWQEKHSDWTYRFWTESNLPALVNQQLFDSMRVNVPPPMSYGFQSDLLRLEVLARYGGVYVDVDNECVRPIDDLLSGNSFVVATEPVLDNRLPNDFIAARPNHPLIWEMIRVAPERALRLAGVVAKGFVPMDMDIAGPISLLERVSSGRFSDLTVLPYQVIHPYRRWAADGYQDYDGAAYVRNHFKPSLGMWSAVTPPAGTPSEHAQAKEGALRHAASA